MTIANKIMRYILPLITEISAYSSIRFLDTGGKFVHSRVQILVVVGRHCWCRHRFLFIRCHSSIIVLV